jgi:hypothetical protein
MKRTAPSPKERPAPKRSAGFAQFIWAFLNSNFGIWFLTSVVVAIAAYLYSERAQCIALQDADHIADLKNVKDLSYMYEMFTRKMADAKDYHDVVDAFEAVGPKRNQYYFSDNKDKTDLQMTWEHNIYVNRWGESPHIYWSSNLDNRIYTLRAAVEDFLNEDDPSTDRIQILSRSAIYIMASNPFEQGLLWDAVREPVGCNIWSIIIGSFRKIDPAYHYP